MKKTSTTLAEASGNPYYGVGGLRAFGAFFANYVNFTGRSTRREYWWYQLWNLLLMAVVVGGLLWGIFGTVAHLLSGDSGALHGGQVAALIGMIFFILIYGFASLVPSLALSVRRFRDAGVHWGVFVAMQVVSAIAGFYTNLHDGFTGGVDVIAAVVVIGISIAEFVITVLPSKNPPHDEPQDTESYYSTPE